ncbi:MAG: hypothetical protein DRP12_01165 [Candidatus Aenigmatarchaeota archaeon]|nr:MAG: hypothetical protein DRP12_01165 [Candidatus Aenigmarchaeota archaeon]
MSAKLVGVWILGSIMLMAAVWIIQKLELTIGVSFSSYLLALAVAFILILLTGLCWISVAVATRRRFL